MKTVILSIQIFLLSSFYLFSQNGEKNFIDQPYIEVTGKIEMEIIPNEIIISIVLNENDKRGKISIENQEKQLISSLKSIGIDIEKQLSIKDYTGNYLKKFLAKNEVSKIKNFELLVNNGKTLDKVFQLCDTLEISNTSIVEVSHSDIERLRRQNKIEALKVAKTKASEYAEAINQKIGNAIHIIENKNDNLNFISNNSIQLRGVSSNLYGSRSNDNLFKTPEFRKIKLTASVQVKTTMQ